jgi:hypothetical protein
VTTRWPGSRSSTPAPILTTVPAASWPSSMGSGRERSPLTTERSEWQMPQPPSGSGLPAAPARRGQAPQWKAGGTGRTDGEPMVSRTAPVIFIVFLQGLCFGSLFMLL